MKPKNFHLHFLIVAALASEILYLFLATLDLTKNVLLFLLLYGLVFLIYWIVAVNFFDLKFTEQKRKKTKSRTRLRWLQDFVVKQETLSSKEILTVGLIFAIIFRLTLLVGTPSLSEDIYRYMWDGKVAAAGINPYEYPPEADELEPLRDEHIYPEINHKEISTIYQPVHQILFETVHRIYSGLPGFKAAFVLFDLLTMLLLFFLLRRFAIVPDRLLLYAWNPLVLLEFSGSGHADIVGISLMLFAFLLLLKKRWIASTIALVLSALTKFISAMFLPLIMTIKRENKLIITLIFLIVGGIFYLPYAGAGRQIFEGLLTYAEKWRFNGLVFWLILTAVQAVLPRSLIIELMIRPQGMTVDAATVASRGTDLALLISKFIVVAIFAGIVIYHLFKFNRHMQQKGEKWYAHLGLIFLGAFILLSPTVHPWYICWVLPFAVLTGNRAWILLSGLVALSYWVLRDYTALGIWRESPWLMFLEYVPFFILLFYDCCAENVRGRTSRLFMSLRSKFRLSSP